jgi:hypothetical protein
MDDELLKFVAGKIRQNMVVAAGDYFVIIFV